MRFAPVNEDLMDVSCSSRHLQLWSSEQIWRRSVVQRNPRFLPANIVSHEQIKRAPQSDEAPSHNSLGFSKTWRLFEQTPGMSVRFFCAVGCDADVLQTAQWERI